MSVKNFQSNHKQLIGNMKKFSGNITKIVATYVSKEMAPAIAKEAKENLPANWQLTKAIGTKKFKSGDGGATAIVGVRKGFYGKFRKTKQGTEPRKYAFYQEYGYYTNGSIKGKKQAMYHQMGTTKYSRSTRQIMGRNPVTGYYAHRGRNFLRDAYQSVVSPMFMPWGEFLKAWERLANWGVLWD